MRIPDGVGESTPYKGLKRDVAFIFVEDDMFTPLNADFTSKRGFNSPWIRNGITRTYSCAENALSDLDDMEPYPELVLSDIDLGQDAIDGLKFAKKMREDANQKGMKPLIYLYSWAINPRKTELDELVKDGIIDGFFDKQDFTVDRFIKEVNTKLIV